FRLITCCHYRSYAYVGMSCTRARGQQDVSTRCITRMSSHPEMLVDFIAAPTPARCCCFCCFRTTAGLGSFCFAVYHLYHVTPSATPAAASAICTTGLAKNCRVGFIRCKLDDNLEGPSIVANTSPRKESLRRVVDS